MLISDSLIQYFRKTVITYPKLNPSVILPITELQVNEHQQFYKILLKQQIYEVLGQSIDINMSH